MNKELYRRLGLDEDATSNQIRVAYRAMVKTCHPDTWPNDEGKAEQFRLLTEAYEILGDAKKKAEYDNTGDIRSSLDADDPRVQALTRLGELFISAIEAIEDPDREDPLKLAINGRTVRSDPTKNLDGAKQTLNKLKKSLKEINDEQAKMKIVRSRLRRKAENDDNALFRMLDHRDRLLSDACRDVKEEIDSYTLVIEMAKGYSYETMLALAAGAHDPFERRSPPNRGRPPIHRPQSMDAFMGAGPDAFDEDED